MTSTPKVLGGRYEIGELIGAGGMADVFEGRDTRLSRLVAIKILRSDLARDPAFLARFRREAQAAGQGLSERSSSTHEGRARARPSCVRRRQQP